MGEEEDGRGGGMGEEEGRKDKEGRRWKGRFEVASSVHFSITSSFHPLFLLSSSLSLLIPSSRPSSTSYPLPLALTFLSLSYQNMDWCLKRLFVPVMFSPANLPLTLAWS